MARSISMSLADLDVMDEAVARLRHVMYARTYFEHRYNDALSRVVDDLGHVGQALVKLIGHMPEKLIPVLRRQFDQATKHPQSNHPQSNADKP
jgi:hypothetical protein